MSGGEFVGALLFLVILSFGGSAAVFKADIGCSNNDIVRRYQLDKLNDFKGVKTVIVGDSSAGNAIEAEYFYELSGERTENLALTGSFGLVGSFATAKRAIKAEPEIRNVIFMQTLDIWTRPFSREGFFEISEDVWGDKINDEFFDYTKEIDYLQYATDVRKIARAAKCRIGEYEIGNKVLGERQIIRVDKENDYLKQTPETYQNGGKKLKGDEKLAKEISEDKVKVYEMIDWFCGENNLNCVFAHGPLNETVYNNSLAEIGEISKIVLGAKNIRPVTDIVVLKNEETGDSIDHVARDYKKAVTKRYFERLKDFLID